jgi:hypothetical protein
MKKYVCKINIKNLLSKSLYTMISIPKATYSTVCRMVDIETGLITTSLLNINTNLCKNLIKQISFVK